MAPSEVKAKDVGDDEASQSSSSSSSDDGKSEGPVAFVVIKLFQIDYWAKWMIMTVMRV